MARSAAMKAMYKCRGGGYSEDPSKCPGGVETSLPGELRVKLSKLVSGILRHFPESYGVKVDGKGWASIDELVTALRKLPGYRWVERWHIEALAALDPKGRFEVSGGKIRARYGHTIKVEVEPLPGEPPRLLYHGTVSSNLPSIKAKGILPMRRLKVHLSPTPEIAVEVGRRHGGDVVVLEVDVECLKEKGLKPAMASKVVYVVDWVPPDCIRRIIRP